MAKTYQAVEKNKTRNSHPRESKRWLFFDRFKMLLHHNKSLGRKTVVEAANGRSVTALRVFAITLNYFKDHALQVGFL